MLARGRSYWAIFRQGCHRQKLPSSCLQSQLIATELPPPSVAAVVTLPFTSRTCAVTAPRQFTQRLCEKRAVAALTQDVLLTLAVMTLPFTVPLPFRQQQPPHPMLRRKMLPSLPWLISHSAAAAAAAPASAGLYIPISRDRSMGGPGGGGGGPCTQSGPRKPWWLALKLPIVWHWVKGPT
eukprot:COSAG01_NODE_7285_length_3271_cov_3.212484_3_plen_181_part_00